MGPTMYVYLYVNILYAYTFIVNIYGVIYTWIEYLKPNILEEYILLFIYREIHSISFITL